MQEILTNALCYIAIILLGFVLRADRVEDHIAGSGGGEYDQGRSGP